MKLENRLKELRARDRLNQTKLAKKAGVSRQTVSLIERGEYAPSVIIALKIAHIFGENVENVFYLKENSDEKQDENYRFTSSVVFCLGIFVANSWLGNFHFSNFLNSTLFGWMIRVLNLILFCMTIYLLQSSRTIQSQSELTNGDELNEQLYQKMFKNLEYGTILLDVVTILTIFDILTLMYSLLKIVF